MRLLAALCLARCGAALPAHPRLILTPARAAEVALLPASADAFARDAAARTLAQAAVAAAAPRAAAGAPNARLVLQRAYTLGVAAALTGNATFAAEGAAGIVHAAAASSWDVNASVPELNTGEMLHAVGVGLDWFYAAMTPAERSAVVAALVARLALIRAALGAAPPPWAVAFASTESNWNMVILGGTVIATLAVEGEPGAPAWVPDLRAAALANILAWSARGWGPDGAWPEGVNYGGYTCRYLVPLAAALLTATGSDGGLRALPGVLAAPRWLVANVAPTLPLPTLWAYFDAHAPPETIGSYLALAAWARDAPAAAGVKRLLAALAPAVAPDAEANTAMNAPLACLYYTPLGAPGEDAALPLVARWRGPLTAAARSGWGDGATFIAFKGHNTSALWAHTHLDGGSFVFASGGAWYAQDMESDSYAAPGYFSGARFNLYRTNVSGHNTLSFGGRDPRCAILATYASDCPASPMTVFNVSAGGGGGDGAPAPPSAPPAAALPVDAFSVVDLTAGFARAPIAGVARVARGFIVGGGRAQLVTVDEVDFSRGAPPAGPLWWSLHTAAAVALAGDAATLSLPGARAPVTVALLRAAGDCAGAVLTAEPLRLAPPLDPTPNITVLRIVAPDARACARLVVAVGVAPPGVGAGVRPLAEWAERGPLL